VLAALAFGLGLVCLWMVRSEIPQLMGAGRDRVGAFAVSAQGARL
jgi:hypothetical protein